MLSHWQRAHSEHNKATMMKINCRVSGLLHLYFEARCDKGPRFFCSAIQKFLVFEGNRMRKPEKERETTRSSKQCEFCNYVRDKSLISQGCQSGSISPDGQSDQDLSAPGGDELVAKEKTRIKVPPAKCYFPDII